MRKSGIRLVAALGFLSGLSMAGAPARAQLPPIGNPGIPGLPGTPVCPPNSSCAPGTPTPPANPPGTCGPGPGGATCGGAGPAAMGGSTGVNVGAGNPINIINGNKYGREVDMAPLPGVLGLEIVRHYNSSLSGPGASTNLVGRGWKLSYETDLYVSGRTVQIVQADGSRIIFNRDPRDPSLCASADPANGTVSIVKTVRGDEYVWRWANGRQLSFDTKGKLVQILAPGGQFVSLRYSPSGLLTRVTDPQGRTLELNYPSREQARAGDAFRGVQSIASPVGRFTYHYGSATPAGAVIDKRLLLASLVKVSMPAGARTYHYEQASHPTLLTGISELVNGKQGKPAWQRIATYGYDINGKANLSVRGWPARLARDADGKPLQPSRLADGTGIGQVTLEYGSGETVVANSQGRKTVFRHAILAGEYRLLEVRGAGCAGCGDTNVRYAYDDLARLQVTTRLSAAGEPLSSERREYDRHGRLVSVIEIAHARSKALPGRLKLRYEYDGDAAYPARILRPSVVPGRFYVTSFKYAQDAALAGLPIEVSEQGYVPTLDGRGSAGTIARTIHYRYDHYGQRVETDGPLPNATSKPGPANSDITLTRYDGRTKLPLRTDMPGGAVTEILERDTALRPTAIRSTDTATVQTVHIRYTWRGQPEEVRVDSTPTDGSPALSRTIGYAYDLNGKLASVTQPGGPASRYRYDTVGRMLHNLLPDGSTVTVAYDTEGRRTAASMLDMNGRRVSMVRYRFDAAGNIAGMDDDLGVLAHTTFTAAGAVSEMTGPLDIVTRFDYDNEGRLARHTGAFGTADAASISFAYDAHGKRIGLTDANGVSTLRRLDDFGRPVFDINPDRGATVYEYDPAGRLLLRGDSRGNVTRYRYDLQGRMVAAGTDALPDMTRYRYIGNRLAEVVATPDGKVEHAAERTSYRYDAFGQVIEEKRWYARVDVKDDKAGLTFVTSSRYDEAGRLSGRRLPDGHQLEYRYSARGGLRAILFDGELVVDAIEQGPGGLRGFTTGNGIRQQIDRDARGRMTAVRALATAPTDIGWLSRLRTWLGSNRHQQGRTIYAQDNRYDAAGRLVQVTRELDKAGSLPSRTVRENFDYDALDRLRTIETSDGPAIRYAYDKGGNRALEARQAATAHVSTGGAAQAGGTRRFAYAPGSNRLTGVTPASADASEGTPMAPVTDMRLRFENVWLYRPGGAPFARIGFAASGPATASSRIAYDNANRAMAVYDDANHLVASYAYNVQGERFAKTVYPAPRPQARLMRTSLSGEQRDNGTGTTSYSLYRDKRLAAEADAQGRITSHYLYLDGRPVARIDMRPNRGIWHRLWQGIVAIGGADGMQAVASASLATVYTIHTDHLGTPQAVTDAHRDVVWQARTTPFGQAQVVHASASAETGKAFDMKLRLPGQAYDAETGLNQNYLRDYDPALGRYTTPDPLGLAGDINPYVYVGNNPLTKTDHLGLYQSDIHFYMTFFLAIAAGIDYEEARTIALATQYVDNNPATRPLDDSNPLTIMLSPLWNQTQLASYHFVLWEMGDNGRAVFSGSKDVGNNSSSQLDRLLAASNKAPTRCAQLQFLGEYLHAFEDTYAHRDSTNVPYGVNNGFGHGLSAGSDPDYTYNDGVYTGNDEIVLARMWAVREDRTLAMEKAVFEKLQAYGDPSKARSWAEVETVVREYNRIRENEQNAPGFTNKLALLTRQLSLWEYKATDSDGNTRAINLTADGRDQYSEEDGHDNRERNLCDLNGNRLKPEDYAGTILPTSNCPSR